MRSRIVAVATIAAAVLTAAPATAGTRMSACRVKPLGTHSEFGQTALVAGAYNGPIGAAEVYLTCGVVHDGVTVDRVGDDTTGPVAALAEIRSVRGGSVTSCDEIKVVYLDGRVTYYDTCP